jgi:hypothetical protein
MRKEHNPMTDLPNYPQGRIKKQIANLLFLLILFISSHLFLADTAAAQPPPAGQTAAQSGYRLIGILKGPALTGAVLGDGAGEQIFYRLHERLPDGSQVVKVRGGIVLKRNDGCFANCYHPTHRRPSGHASSEYQPGRTKRR